MKRLLMLVLFLCLLCGCYPKEVNSADVTQNQPSGSITQTTQSTVLPTEQAATQENASGTGSSISLPTVTQTESKTEQNTEPEVQTEPEPISARKIYQYGDMKAMWLSQFDMAAIYLDGNIQRNETDFTARMMQVFDNIKEQGFNTIFLQIRPYADSMYPSNYYPISAYVAGQYGGQIQYDPVDIIIRLAHDRELSIHGWINPLRGMTEQEIQMVDSEYPIRRWYDDPELRGRYIVLVNGRWYLNPAYEEVSDLICSGAEEALLMYDFDGLHMDDYFYPTTDTGFDSDAYAEYQASGGSLDLADFRRSRINQLVYRLRELTHSSFSGRIFGISPAGNADTAYNTHYADVYRWCAEEGYVDYICPQVYFGLEHGSHNFVKVSNTYQDMIQSGSVDLIIGMTFGKAFTQEDQWAGTGKDEWKNNKDVLARCLQTTLNLDYCRGVSIFSYQYFFDPLTGQSIAETEEERGNFVPVFQNITWQ